MKRNYQNGTQAAKRQFNTFDELKRMALAGEYFPAGTPFITKSGIKNLSKPLGRGSAPAVSAGVPFSVRPELKGVDGSLAIAGPVLASTNTNGDCFVLNAVAPGNGSYNRVGRKIRLKSIRLVGQLLHRSNPVPVAGDLVENTLRMVVVYDKQPSGALPSFNDVFGVTDQLGNETATFLNNLRYDNTDRFRVLKDCVILAKPGWADHTGGGSYNVNSYNYHFDEFIKLKGLITQFSGQSSPCTIADISSGGLFVYFRARVATDEVNDIVVTPDSFWRLRYYDA